MPPPIRGGGIINLMENWVETNEVIVKKPFGLLFRLDALAKALSVIAMATWLAGWCLSQPVLYQND